MYICSKQLKGFTAALIRSFQFRLCLLCGPSRRWQFEKFVGANMAEKNKLSSGQFRVLMDTAEFRKVRNKAGRERCQAQQ